MKKLISSLLCCAMLLSGAAAVTLSGTAAEDPWDSYVPVHAAAEDSGLSLWFEHSTAKVKQTDTAASGMDTYCIHSAKNEIETCQFVLFAKDGRSNLTASITDFTNESGGTVSPELFYEHYMDIGGGEQNPDALPPLTSSFDLEAELSRAFLIKVKVPADAEAGVYRASLSIYNSAGEQVKTADVYLKVWDFALPEATSCATSVGLDLNQLTRFHSGIDSKTLYKTYYDFLLENRICAYILPENVYSTSAEVYLNNPRVTSFRVASYSGDFAAAAMKRAYSKLLTNDEWFEKGYFFSSEDPVDMESLRKISDRYNSLNGTLSTVIPEGKYPRFNYVSTFFTDIAVSDGVDEIDYLDDYVSVWCPKPFAFTPASEIGTVPGAKLLQDTSWDSVYGTFADRMNAYKARGDKLWWFTSWDVEAPYANFFTQTDGVTHRVLFWQQKDCGVDGFLYNFANFWFAGDDPWTDSLTNVAYPGVYGDSVLVYPGNKVGIDGPVSSLRLEAMRDGIEDFEYLTLIETKLGTAKAKEYISMVSKSVTTYTHDDDVFATARVTLGDAVEKALNAEYTKGDINCDGSINNMDILILKRFIIGKVELTDNGKLAADIKADGRINIFDLIKIKRFIIGMGTLD